MMIAHLGFGVLLYFYFFQEHASVQQLLTAEFFGSLAAAVYMVFRRIFFSRWDMLLGFGLYVAKGAVEAQGGRIAFTSNEGKGTSFKVELPILHPDCKKVKELNHGEDTKDHKAYEKKLA